MIERRLVVRESSRTKELAKVLIALLLMLGGSWALYTSGGSIYADRVAQAESTESALRESLSRAEKDLRMLQRTTADLSSRLRVREQVIEQARDELYQLRANSLELEKKLEIYERVLVDLSEAKELGIHDVSIAPSSGAEGTFLISITVTNSLRAREPLPVSAEIFVEVSDDSQVRRVPIRELLRASPDEFQFEVRHLRRMSWMVRIPLDVRPVRVLARVSGRVGDRTLRAERTRDWPTQMAG